MGGFTLAKRRAVITGIGLITPAGSTIETFWDNVTAGRSAVREISRFDASAFATRIAAEVRDFDPLTYLDRKEARHMDRFTQFGVVAADRALADAGLDPLPAWLSPDRVAVWIGSGIGGMGTIETQMSTLLSSGPRRVSPFTVPMLIANMAAGQVAVRRGFGGRCGGPVTACATGTNAVGDGLRFIQSGEADVVLAGAAEAAITPFGIAAFCAAGAMSTRNDDPEHACRPFDRERDGFVMGEGAAVLVLEEAEHATARGARVYAELLGYGTNGDGYHIVQPRPDGTGAAKCLGLALADAGLRPDEVDYLNAHGTGTKANDAAESKAVKLAFGEYALPGGRAGAAAGSLPGGPPGAQAGGHLAISSTKPVMGHLMGASGAAEAAVAALAVWSGVIPPTANLAEPDPECDLDYVPGTARRQDVRVAMSVSLGFGGHNAAVVLGRAS